MKKKVIILILLILIIGGTLGFLYYKNRKVANELTLYGNIEIRQVDLSFQVSGKIEKMLKEEGDTVKAGELIAVIDDKDTTWGKKHPGKTRTAYLRGIYPHLFDFAGAVKRRVLHQLASIALRGKDLWLFILKKPDPCIVHCDIGFCKAVETKPTANLAFQPIGVGVSCQIGCKTLRPVVQQPAFGTDLQPITTEFVPVVGAEKSTLFQIGYD